MRFHVWLKGDGAPQSVGPVMASGRRLRLCPRALSGLHESNTRSIMWARVSEGRGGGQAVVTVPGYRDEQPANAADFYVRKSWLFASHSSCPRHAFDVNVQILGTTHIGSHIICIHFLQFYSRTLTHTHSNTCFYTLDAFLNCKP